MSSIVQRSDLVCITAQKCNPTMTHLTVTCTQLTCCGGYVIVQERIGFKMMVYIFKSDTIHDRVGVALIKRKDCPIPIEMLWTINGGDTNA